MPLHVIKHFKKLNNCWHRYSLRFKYLVFHAQMLNVLLNTNDACNMTSHKMQFVATTVK